MDIHDQVDGIVKGILDSNEPEVAQAILGELYTQHPEMREIQHNRPIADGVVKSNPGPDADTMTKRYLEGVGNSGARWAEGMQNPRRDPKAAALKAKGKYKQRVEESLRDDSWAKGIARYDLAEAVSIATADGGAAFVAGAQKREAKVMRAFQRLQPLLASVSQTIQNMPQDTPEQREQRLLQSLRLMRNVGKQFKG